MQQKRFRNSAGAGPMREFHYRGKPARAGGFSTQGRAGHGGSSGGRGGKRGFGSKNGGRGFGGRRGPGGGMSTFMDVSKFVNKATVTEKTENFVPDHAFIDFPIDARLKANIARKGYVTPTPIQDKSIPHILRGSDLVGIANTGTGKTAAFLLPLISKVLSSGNSTGQVGAPITGHREKVLIVVPTRELALQIENEFKLFAFGLGLHAVSCVGGSSIGMQLKWLSRPTQFVIGTPGRLKDLIERNAINLAQFNTVVLDEADRMLDMGFINDMKYLLGKMPPPPPVGKRQTLFFSATTSREIDNLIRTLLYQPVMISVKTGDTAEHVDQDIVRVPVGKNKFDVLVDLLRSPGFDKVLIFGRTKHGIDRLAKSLTAVHLHAESIHGNKNQNQRVKALKLFSDQHVKILCATDVAARGLDIAGVSHVINFDLPATYEDYVHRIGRTGRAGKGGKALTFV